MRFCQAWVTVAGSRALLAINESYIISHAQMGFNLRETVFKSSVIISMAFWNFLFASISMLIYLFFGVFFFGVDLTSANIPAVILILVMTIISFSSIGIISASFVMIFKKGDPVTWLISLFSAFFGGVYFPVAILPKTLQIVSHLLPMTYALRALRYALLRGYAFNKFAYDMGVLLIFCIVFFPLSLLIFKYAVKKAKIKGSLAHY